MAVSSAASIEVTAADAALLGVASRAPRNSRHLVNAIQACYRGITVEGTFKRKDRVQPILSARLRDGTMLEAIVRPRDGSTALLRHELGVRQELAYFAVGEVRYVPYSPKNNLLTHRVTLLASGAEEYGSAAELVKAVQAFVHRYVDVDLAFEEIAAHYVLLTWGYDVFNELPYLRVRGDYGTGKSRFLLTIGSLCYKPIFASGASTVSPLFRLMDQVGGTLVVDEADFWASDERAEIIKILNNGNARGFPVLRSEVTPTKEFSPRAFDIFGPKIIATRHEFQDQALESRCLTCDLSGQKLRSDIPVSLPRTFEEEALQLRNQLLKYRFDRFANADEPPIEMKSGLTPRRAQILAPLLSVATRTEARKRILAFARSGADSDVEQRQRTEGRLLLSVSSILRTSPPSLSLSALARQFAADWNTPEVTPRVIGSMLRRLGVQPQKSNGIFVVASANYPHLRRLIDEYLRDIGDDGDVLSRAGADGHTDAKAQSAEGSVT